MNAGAKIHLSPLEKELIQNKEFILTKRTIIDKVCLLFSELPEVYKGISRQEKLIVPGAGKDWAGKISKGENYLGLPYVILDYPAFFSKENIFAIRTMFWWGHFFSVTLHLSGKNIQWQNNTGDLLAYLKEYDFFVCISENQWEHHFGATNYIPASALSACQQEEIFNGNFFKIARKIELCDWDFNSIFLREAFREVCRFLQINSQAGERAPLPGFPKAGSGL